MASGKKEKNKVAHARFYNAKAPCVQPFNIGGVKPGKKVRSWWNGYRSSHSTAAQD